MDEIDYSPCRAVLQCWLLCGQMDIAIQVRQIHPLTSVHFSLLILYYKAKSLSLIKTGTTGIDTWFFCVLYHHQVT